MNNTKLIKLLGSDAPDDTTYSLVINKGAMHPEFKYFISTPIVSEILIGFSEGEIERLGLKEEWFDNTLHAATMTFMDVNTGEQDVIDVVNVIGWVDHLVIRGDNMVCQILKRVCLEIQAGRVNEAELIEAFVSVARYLEYKELPIIKKMYHNLEKMCKEEGFNRHDIDLCVTLALEENVQPHDGCSELFVFDTEQLPIVQNIIDDIKIANGI